MPPPNAAAGFPVVSAYVDAGGNAQGVDSQHGLPVSGLLLNAVQLLPARPANTTAYAANQAYNIAPLTVLGATNAVPAVVNVAAHGLASGQAVNISGAVGNTAINGTWLVVVVDANHFTLTDIAGAAVAGNGAWTSGGSVILLLTFPGISRLPSGRGYLTKAKLALDGVAMVATWRLWLYNGLATPFADQATFTILKANNGLRVGYVDLATVTGGAGSDCSFGQASGGSGNLPLEFTADQNGALYGILVPQGAATPISGGTGRVTLSADAY